MSNISMSGITEIEVKFSSKQESNLFLRALWAELRKEFGKCAWNYCPYKDGPSKLIFIGFADVGLGEPLGVSVRYKQRDCIEKITFTSSLINEHISKKLSQCVAVAKSMQNQTITLGAVATVKIISGWFKGQNQPDGILFTRMRDTDFTRTTFKMAFSGYDAADIGTIARERTQSIIDALAAISDLCIIEESLTIAPTSLSEEMPIQIVSTPQDDEFAPLSHRASEDGVFRLSSIQSNAIHMIINEHERNAAMSLWLQACSHFHMARNLETLEHPKPFEEVILVLYVSALEVASSIEAHRVSNCDKCGQEIYSISKRVYDFVHMIAGDSMAAIVKNLYISRSKYLHVGHLLSKRNYVGFGIPQLDAANPSGCQPQTPNINHDLSAIVSFCLRGLLKTFPFLHGESSAR